MRQAVDDIQAVRDRVTQWMRLGRADRVVAAYDESRWGPDAYLLLQYAEALGYLDRLSEAERVYRRAKALPSASEGQRAFVDRRLAWLEDEWRRIADARGGLTRSLAIGGLGLVVLFATSGIAWVIARREKVSKTSV